MKKKEEYDLKNLESKLNYNFKRIELLKEAITHSSYNNRSKKNGVDNFQRLEFLGDSVLELIVSEYIYYKLISFSEGELTKIKSIIVSKSTLAKWANQISLGKFIILGKGEDLTGGRSKLSILSDCFEALLGAIYLDAGLKKTGKIIIPFIKDEIKLITQPNYVEDYKTLLQEISQKKMKCLPEYNLIKEKGPDHKKIFCVEVKLNEVSYGTGFGDNKKEAEQDAAHNALKKLKILK
ncbi:MAG: ribonuclease III [Atribacterota bacterium]